MKRFRLVWAILFAIFMFTGCATVQQKAYTPSNVELLYCTPMTTMAIPHPSLIIHALTRAGCQPEQLWLTRSEQKRQM